MAQGVSFVALRAVSSFPIADLASWVSLGEYAALYNAIIYYSAGAQV